MEPIIFIVFLAIGVFGVADFVIISDIITGQLGDCPLWFAVFIAVCGVSGVIYLTISLIKFLQDELGNYKNKII